MLGKLAKGLRMLGYDTIYYRGEDRQQLIELGRHENRLILTRNTKLISKRPEDQIFRITKDNHSLQLEELIKKGYISLDERSLFSRCLDCNGPLMEIPREEAQGKVPDFIFYHQKGFFRCPLCKKIFWRGSHHQNMERRLKGLFQPSSLLGCDCGHHVK